VVGLPGLVISPHPDHPRPARRAASQPFPVRDVGRTSAPTPGRVSPSRRTGPVALVNYGFGWLPTFFVRTYGWKRRRPATCSGGQPELRSPGGPGGRLADALQARGWLRFAGWWRGRPRPGHLRHRRAADADRASPRGSSVSFFASAPFGVMRPRSRNWCRSDAGPGGGTVSLVLNLVGLAFGPTAWRLPRIISSATMRRPIFPGPGRAALLPGPPADRRLRPYRDGRPAARLNRTARRLRVGQTAWPTTFSHQPDPTSSWTGLSIAAAEEPRPDRRRNGSDPDAASDRHGARPADHSRSGSRRTCAVADLISEWNPPSDRTSRWPAPCAVAPSPPVHGRAPRRR
jgi:hypothetical protein